LAKDSVDFVRQGALIALSMILVQHNEVSCPKVTSTRKLFEDVISNKRDDILARVGAALGQGIIDAGGRNVTISLQSRSGYSNIPAIVGMALFTQFWYWFPLAHFLSLAFTPTGVIGLNKDLEAPVFSFLSNAKPSIFAYPPMTKPPTTEVVAKVATAVLSTTAKSKARAKKAQKGDGMEVDEKKDEETPVVAAPPEEPKKEESFEVLENFSRVVPGQMKYISIESSSRYTPIKKVIVVFIYMCRI
jgi:26S proteasome regulatory subunit N2